MDESRKKRALLCPVQLTASEGDGTGTATCRAGPLGLGEQRTHRRRLQRKVRLQRLLAELDRRPQRAAAAVLTTPLPAKFADDKLQAESPCKDILLARPIGSEGNEKQQQVEEEVSEELATDKAENIDEVMEPLDIVHDVVAAGLDIVDQVSVAQMMQVVEVVLIQALQVWIDYKIVGCTQDGSIHAIVNRGIVKPAAAWSQAWRLACEREETPRDNTEAVAKTLADDDRHQRKTQPHTGSG